MANWFNKLLGGSGSSVTGQEPPWILHLRRMLQPLDQLRDGLARDTLSYVLEGEPLSVLPELSQSRAIGNAGNALGVFHTAITADRTPHNAFYEHFDQLSPAVGLRWARALEAASAPYIHLFKFALPSAAHWPEALLMHAAGAAPNVWSTQAYLADKLSAMAMEALLAESGLESSALLVSAFATPVSPGYAVEQRLRMVMTLRGYADAVATHLETLRPHLLPAAVAQRLHVLSMLVSLPQPILAQVAAEVVELATSSSKQVRGAAEPVIRNCGRAAVAPLRRTAVESNPEQRLNALRLCRNLADVIDDRSLLVFARETALADKAPSVQALIGEWDSAAAAASAEIKYDYQMPQIEWRVTMTPALQHLLDDLWRQLNQSIEQANKQAREWHEQMKARGNSHSLRQEPPLSAAELKTLRDHLSSTEARLEKPIRPERTLWRHWPVVQKLASAEAMTPVIMLKVLDALTLAFDNNNGLNMPALASINAMHKASQKPSLLELSVMMEGMGLLPTSLFGSYCRRWGSFASEWSNAAVWPYFAHHLEELQLRLTNPLAQDIYSDRAALFRAVASLPVTPPVLINTLFDLALGSAKGDRVLAQAALGNHAGKERRIVMALGSAKAEVRAVAANWLMRLRHAEAVPALETAMAKEKNDVAKGALLDALEALGQPVEKYLDRTVLVREAAKSLSKGVPKDIEWFPWNALPTVRWADSGEVVPTDVVKWLLVQACRQKSPEPNAVLRKYCAMFEPRDREALGQFVLDNWLREDVRPIAPEEAQRRALAQAQSIHSYMQRAPQYYQNSPMFGRSVEELTAVYLPALLRMPAGSAIASKGLLAVAAACAGERAAAPVARYLKDYYGTRAGQGKALIAMLAWVAHPTATQLMLSIGARFRTKSFQQEATRQAEALAERNNWTLSELADRTIPSAGFDEDGEMDLSYGERAFTARLLPDFKIELYNPEGKKIASLPEPRQDDDAERAKEAKKAFSGAKKEIKTIVALQTERLYEALCTGRDWAFTDWALYLNRHPVVRRLLQRLVWVEVGEGRARSFRPMDDGSLTDCEDSAVLIADDTRVRVAHDTLLSPEIVARWQQHLVDYEVAPLFQQLGKGTYVLPPDRAGESAVEDFKGHMLESFALRGRATKLGYTRGSPEDGGWFYTYEKRFPTLGLTAVIEFTGSPLPEENRAVALIRLQFTAGDGGWQRNGLPLGKVPKILLSECYNDLRLMAAEGSGYDPEWEKKGYS